MSWTDQEIKILKANWTAGDSASQIVKALDSGKTRNAVLAKLGRLGLLKTRGNTTNKAAPFSRMAWSGNGERKPPAAIKKPDPPKAQPPLLVDGKSFTALSIPFSGACKFPYECSTVEGGFIFCGHQPFGTTPYCEFHAARCFEPPKRRAA